MTTLRATVETRIASIETEISGLEAGRSGEYTNSLYDEIDGIIKTLRNEALNAIDASEDPAPPYEVISAVRE